MTPIRKGIIVSSNCYPITSAIMIKLQFNGIIITIAIMIIRY
ncbi:unnamed protein product [Onchocerca flexuosa]|uniref:Uncharacterized protein n=1 Tax=Onchocerca flexuosa TaxID=387005 RepID=A0A183HXI4_9BILA|nr:unnamed protein product [Onchocerca flexuosa]